MAEIETCGKDVLTPNDVCKVLGCTAYAINQQAKYAPDMLGFPVMMIGKRVKIPREGFIRFMKGQN